MQIVEIFNSIQGEGTLIGHPMVFIRLWGCDMNCIWCDTKYSWSPEFKEITRRTEYSPIQLSKLLKEQYKNFLWINFTGGEPTLWSNEIKETIILLERKFKVSIQTNGKKWDEELFSKIDKICMDFKCPASGEKSDLKNLRFLSENDEAKFVIEDDHDFKYAIETIKENPTRASIIFQPVMQTAEDLNTYFKRVRWIAEQVKLSELNRIRILPQLHQLLWRDQQGR